jgi:hypothetical protein
MGPFYYLFLIGGADGVIDRGGLLKTGEEGVGIIYPI